MGNSPKSPPWFHRHLCWRLLSSRLPAPASFLRKLGSPWEQVCPWGRPLSSVPCSWADNQRTERGSAPPACTCASPGGRERLRRGVQQEGEREARQNLGPRRPGRPRRSCSLQQVRRTRARSPRLRRRVLRRAGSLERPWPQALRRGARRGRLPGPPPCSRQLSAAAGSSGARRRAPRAPSRFSTTSGTAPTAPRVPAAGQHWRGGQRPPGRLLGSPGPCSAPRPPRTVPSPPRAPLPASAPRRRTALATRPLAGEPRTKQSRGAAASRCARGVGVCFARGDFGFPHSSVRRAGAGGLVAVARLWLGSAVRQGLAVQWRVPAGSRKAGRRGHGRRGPAGRAGPELGARCAPPTPPSGPPPPPSSGPRTFRRARHRCPRLAAAITDSGCLRNIPRKCEAEFRGGGGRGTAGKPQERAATGSPSILPGFLPLPPERRCEERGGWGEPQQVVKEAWQRARKEADEV